jgi:large-conductance mechanosensitive channel
LNPWVVIVAVVIFIAVSSVMYAMDRYKQYKVEAEMRLQQYQQEQKDKIKQQKRKAYSH